MTIATTKRRPLLLIIAAFLLPFAMGLCDSLISSLCWSLPIDGSLWDLTARLPSLLIPIIQSSLLLLLVNYALAAQQLPFKELARRGWKWLLGLTVVAQLVLELHSWLRDVVMTGLPINKNTDTIDSIWSTLAAPLAGLLWLGTAVLLTYLVLCRGSEDTPRRPSWNRTSALLLVAAVAAVVLTAVLDSYIRNAQLAEWQQMKDSQSLAGYLGLMTGASFAYGMNPTLRLLLEGVQTVLALAFCVELAGGSLRATTTEQLGRCEPLELTDEAERGQRRLKCLLWWWLGAMAWLFVGGIFTGDSLGLDYICFGGCIAVFLYSGRRWARGLWIAQTAVDLSAIGLSAMMLFSGAQYAVVATMGVAFYLPVTVVNLLICWGMLRRGASINSYMLHCMVSPPTASQRKWEHRATTVFWVVIAIEVVGTVLIFI